MYTVYAMYMEATHQKDESCQIKLKRLWCSWIMLTGVNSATSTDNLNLIESVLSESKQAIYQVLWYQNIQLSLTGLFPVLLI